MGGGYQSAVESSLLPPPPPISKGGFDVTKKRKGGEGDLKGKESSNLESKKRRGHRQERNKTRNNVFLKSIFCLKLGNAELQE